MVGERRVGGKVMREWRVGEEEEEEEKGQKDEEDAGTNMYSFWKVKSAAAISSKP